MGKRVLPKIDRAAQAARHKEQKDHLKVVDDLSKVPERGSGRTHRIIEAMEKGSILLVHNLGMKNYARDIIAKVHGEGHDMKVLVVVDRYSLEMTRGYSRKIYVDHWLLDTAPHDLKAAITNLRHYVELPA